MKHSLLGVFALVAIALPRIALACGGCFSPAITVPEQVVVQNAERVFFHQDALTKKTTVWVEVRYAGAAQDFGWVLPVPKVPKVGTGPRYLFDVLDQRLAQRFLIYDKAAENCRNPRDGCNYPPAGSDLGFVGDASSGTYGGGKAGSVDVLEQGQTGPYDYVVLSAKEAKPLQDWLTGHGYKTPDKATPIIASHLAKGDVFVAIKLQNGAGIDLIRPITLEMQDSDPCVPLRLTSIAAEKDMTVAVMLAGAGRAVPKNHMHVVVNPLRINWFSTPPGNNYPQVLAAAIDEAAGHAFATEFAGPASYVSDIPKQYVTLAKELTVTVNAFAVVKVLDAYKDVLPMTDETAPIFDKHMGLSKLVPGVSAAQALAMLRACVPAWDASMGFPCFVNGKSIYQDAVYETKVDGGALTTELVASFLAPVGDVLTSIQTTKRLTRLVLRISPEEMDRDPIFDFNDALPDVSNIMKVVRNKACTTGWLPADRTRLTFDGLGSWLFSKPDGATNTSDPRFKDAPLTSRIELLDATGDPLPVAKADIELVDTAIKGALPGKPSLPTGLTLKTLEPWTPPASDAPLTALGAWQKPNDCPSVKSGYVSGAIPGSVNDSGGCGMSTRPASLLAMAMIGLCVLLMRRRRR